MRTAVLVGSLRRESYSLKIAKALMKLAPSYLNMEIIKIGELPIYNQDADDDKKPPEAYIGDAAKLFDSNGDLNNESTRDFIQKFMSAFDYWVSEKNHLNNFSGDRFTQLSP